MATAIGLLDPRFRPWANALLAVARRYGLRPQITSTYRSYEEQRRLYNDWLAGRSRYPAAPPGRSLHQYGLALDLVSRDNTWLGHVWRYWGAQWSPRDEVHFGAY